MDTSSAIVVTIMLVLLITLYGASAQPAAAPGPATDPCLTAVLGMSDCLSYVQEGSNTTVPDKPCCPELKTLVDKNPVCLCKLLANGDSLGFKIDMKKALKLPSVCKVDAPPVSTCSLAGIPVPGPTADEVSSSAPGPHSSEGAATTAAKDKANDSSRIAASTLGLLMGLSIAFLYTLF